MKKSIKSLRLAYSQKALEWTPHPGAYGESRESPQDHGTYAIYPDSIDHLWLHYRSHDPEGENGYLACGGENCEDAHNFLTREAEDHHREELERPYTKDSQGRKIRAD